MRDEIHKELFVISEDFFKIQPWQLLDDCDILGLFLRGKDELYFASIMGSGGMEYGVLFLKGWEGFKILSDTVKGDMDHDTMMNNSHTLSLTLSHRDDVSQNLIRYHTKYNRNITSSMPFPLFQVKEPQKVFKPPRDTDAQTLCLCIKAIIKLIKSDLLEAKTLRKGDKTRRFEVTEKDGDVHITSRYENIVTLKSKPKTLKIDDTTLNQLKALPKLQTIYNVAAPAGMVAIRDRIPRVFFIHDERRDCILVMQVFYERELEAGAFGILKDVFLGKNFLKQRGLPDEIKTDSRLFYDHFKQILASLGVRVVCVESIPKVEEIIEGFQNFPYNGKEEQHSGNSKGEKIC